MHERYDLYLKLYTGCIKSNYLKEFLMSYKISFSNKINPKSVEMLKK